MILYDQYGRPVDIRTMMQYYNQKVGPSPFAPEEAKQRAPDTNEWNINLSGKPEVSQPTTNFSIETDPGIKFQPISSGANIQELGNKEARLGDTMLYYNPDTGELYKKYVDFLTGQLIVESAKFTKGKSAVPLLTVDKLHEMMLTMQADINSMKGDSSNVKNDSRDGMVVVQE